MNKIKEQIAEIRHRASLVCSNPRTCTAERHIEFDHVTLKVGKKYGSNLNEPPKKRKKEKAAPADQRRNKIIFD